MKPSPNPSPSRTTHLFNYAEKKGKAFLSVDSLNVSLRDAKSLIMMKAIAVKLG